MGGGTYFFRGNIVNNYVNFAGFTWRIVRINEDGTIRLVLQDAINDNAIYKGLKLKYPGDTYSEMYYSNWTNEAGYLKYELNNWFNTKIASNPEYLKHVASGNYFCEQAKVGYESDHILEVGNAKMVTFDNYHASFKCESDGNGYGNVNSNVGLLTFDEVIFAGGNVKMNNTTYYLYNPNIYWYTMSPGGISNWVIVWRNHGYGELSYPALFDESMVRPVINLNTDTIITGTGTIDDMYVVQ